MTRRFFQQDPVLCARALVGCRFNWGRCSGLVVETEAYAAKGDAACHTAFRPGARTFVREQREGTAYVYFAYGMHWMLNVLIKGDRDGFVLIRALEPLGGKAAMRRRRKTKSDLQLCSGPGKLSQALGVSGRHHGMDLCQGREFGFEFASPVGTVLASPRIGISRAKEKPWRFFLAGNKNLSGSRKMNRLQKRKKAGQE